MTIDLFAEPAPPAAAAPVKRPRAEGETFAMQPTGDLNRWMYAGEIVVYDPRRAVGSPLGQWRTVERVGMPVLHSDDRIEVCRAIDARLATESPQ